MFYFLKCVYIFNQRNIGDMGRPIKITSMLGGIELIKLNRISKFCCFDLTSTSPKNRRILWIISLRKDDRQILKFLKCYYLDVNNPDNLYTTSSVYINMFNSAVIRKFIELEHTLIINASDESLAYAEIQS